MYESYPEYENKKEALQALLQNKKTSAVQIVPAVIAITDTIVQDIDNLMRRATLAHERMSRLEDRQKKLEKV